MLQSAALALWLACIVEFASLPSSQAKSKLPPWNGPDAFFDGPLPSKRSQHGFASCDDGRIYVFGGQGQQGEILGLCNVVMTYTGHLRCRLPITMIAVLRRSS
jgi:hypothetical protein